VLGILVLAGLAGCEGLKDPTTAKPDPVATAPAEPSAQTETPKDLKPKNVALPTIPKGAGNMDDDAPEEMTPTSTGLYYRILRKSDGRKPTVTDKVLAHYKGWLDDGKQFDSSYDRGEPSEFPLSGVIKGWTEGLQLIGEGGMIELEIPGRLGYPQGGPGIPPMSTLHFIVELKEVK
jgi:FKBP-type peptidyl-prolyl cis-trans isomerase